MNQPERPTPDPLLHPMQPGLGVDSGTAPDLRVLTTQAFLLRSSHHYALHPIEAALQYLRAEAEVLGQESHGGGGFEAAEAHYRTGAQGLRLSEIPQLPQQLRELSRLEPVDRAGRKALRKWAEDRSNVFDENTFLQSWRAQGERGGA